MPKFYAKNRSTPINTLLYVSAIPSTRWHKVFGVGIISAFNPLSISDLARKTPAPKSIGLVLISFISKGFEERGRVEIRSAGNIFSIRLTSRTKNCSRDTQELKQAGGFLEMNPRQIWRG
jgi:hypothetical protein